MQSGRYYPGKCETSDAGRSFLYGAPAFPAGGDHISDGAVPHGTQTDASGVSLRGPGAEYGADRGTAGGKSRMTVEKPLIVYKEPGKYTDEIYDVYGY